MNWGGLLSGLWGGIKPYATDPMAWLATMGTGAGIYDMYSRQKAEKDYLRKQRDWMGQVQARADAPLNVEAIFNPGKALIQRQLEAGLSERGLQPGGAYMGAMGEGMMKHWLDATALAERQRSGQLGAMTNVSPARPAYPGAGDTSALGKYLQFIRESKAAETARGQQQGNLEQFLAALRGGGQPSAPLGVPGRSQDMNMYPDIPDSGSPYEGWYE